MHLYKLYKILFSFIMYNYGLQNLDLIFIIIILGLLIIYFITKNSVYINYSSIICGCYFIMWGLDTMNRGLGEIAVLI